MRPRSLLLLALPLLAGAIALAAHAAEPTPSAATWLRLRPRAWRPPVLASTAGLRAAIDPATGEWTLPGATPSPLGLAAVRPAARIDEHADGSSTLWLNGLARAYTIARIGADGRLVRDCADSGAEAMRRLASPLPPAAPAEDR